MLVYIFLSVGFILFQDKLIFQPDQLEKNYVFEFDQPFEEFFIPMHDGVEVNVLLFRTQQPRKGLIIYFHGNADNLQRWGESAADLLPFGYDVLMMDYRGYGKSMGKPSEQILYRDAQTLLNWAKENLHYDRLVIYGRSLGSTVASNLAGSTNSYGLILETPFDEIRSLVYPPFKPLLIFFPDRHRFSNKEHLTRVTCRVLVLQGTHDWVVPLSSAIQLKPFLKEDDEFVIIDGGDHKNLREYPEYLSALKKMLD